MPHIIDPQLVSLCQSRGGAPPILPGAPMPDRLRAGSDAAGAALRKYTPALDTFDDAKAQAAVAYVDAWADANNDKLKATMADPNATQLSTQLTMVMPADVAQNFLLSSYWYAAAYMGPHLTNAVQDAVGARKVINGQQITATWAKDDAQSRLDTFSMILRLEEQGELAHIFNPPQPANGLGAPLSLGAIIVIAIASVLIAAVIVYGVNQWHSVSVNSKTMEELCKEAQAKGDGATVQKCIGVIGDISKPEPPFNLQPLVWVAAVGGAIWIASKVDWSKLFGGKASRAS
jgi:hypothetical protein